MIDKLNHDAGFFFADFLENFGIIFVLFQIVFEHCPRQTHIEIVTAQERVTIGAQVLNFQNFGRVFASGNFVQSNIKRAAAQIEDHDVFFRAQVQNLRGNFAVAHLVNKVVNYCLRLTQQNLTRGAVSFANFNAGKFGSFERVLSHCEIEIRGHGDNGVVNFFQMISSRRFPQHVIQNS